MAKVFATCNRMLDVRLPLILALCMGGNASSFITIFDQMAAVNSGCWSSAYVFKGTMDSLMMTDRR